MSNLLIPVSYNPEILHLCRNIIRIQKYEIWEMERMKNGLSNDLFTKDKFIKYPCKCSFMIYTLFFLLGFKMDMVIW